MKKILIATNVLTLAILFCVVFKSQMGAKAQPKVGKSAISTSPQLCDTNNLPWKTIEEFSKAVAQYRNNHYALYNNSMGAGFHDARSFFYSFQRLKEFMCIVENSASQYNVNRPITRPAIDVSKLGIRFYYCEYPKRVNDPLSKLHTLFLTSTYFNDSMSVRKNVDFDAFRTLSAKKIVPIWKLIQSYPSPGLIKTASILGPSNDVLNQGDLCPPSTGCSETINQVDLSFTGQQN